MALIKKTGRDLRWGLRVLKEAGFRASKQVTEEDIREAMEIVDRDMLTLLEKSETTPMNGAVYQLYKEACYKLGLPPKTMRHIVHYVTPKLEIQGPVTSREKASGEGEERP
ncbi:hypothetical protein P8X24_08320 [Pyrococcus kukulkanii]|uniref:hypothetical protein n=1 Tax=Pyrococcus kukulkanii TaxID=1609559 RepID=UPI0035672DC8